MDESKKRKRCEEVNRKRKRFEEYCHKKKCTESSNNKKRKKVCIYEEYRLMKRDIMMFL